MKKTITKKETNEVEIITALYCDNCNIELSHKTAKFGGHHAFYERREYLNKNGFLQVCEFPLGPVSEIYTEENFHEIRLCDKCVSQLQKQFPCFDRRK